jgi:hypothetical protein
VFVLWWRQRQKKQAPTAFAELNKAPAPVSTQHLRHLAATAPVREFYHAFLLHWEHVLAAHTGIAHADITKNGVRDNLTAQGTPQNLINDVLELWDQAEFALYAGQTPKRLPVDCVETAEALEKNLGAKPTP